MVITVVAGAAGVTMWLWSTRDALPQEQELAAALSEYQVKRQEIAIQNGRLRLIETIGQERTTWSDRLAELLAVLPDTARIETLTVNTEAGTVSFTGTDVSRDSLVTMEEALRGLTWVTRVSAPNANLLLRFNPAYTFTLETHDGE